MWKFLAMVGLVICLSACQKVVYIKEKNTCSPPTINKQMNKNKKIVFDNQIEKLFLKTKNIDQFKMKEETTL